MARVRKVKRIQSKPGRLTLGQVRARVNQQFGPLKLIGAQWRRCARVSFILCRVACVKGHAFSLAWHRLRNPATQPPCPECNPKPKAERPNGQFEHVTGKRLDEAIEALSADRRRLFEALIDSRKHAGGDNEFEFEEIRYDAWAYASQVPDPAVDLAELDAPIGNTRAVYSMTGWAMKQYGETGGRH